MRRGSWTVRGYGVDGDGGSGRRFGEVGLLPALEQQSSDAKIHILSRRLWELTSSGRAGTFASAIDALWGRWQRVTNDRDTYHWRVISGETPRGGRTRCPRRRCRIDCQIGNGRTVKYLSESFQSSDRAMTGIPIIPYQSVRDKVKLISEQMSRHSVEPQR